MATPPTVRSPTWADDGGADVTDPGTSKQATGWIEGEAPAADHTNWWKNATGQWIEYFISFSPINVVGMFASDFRSELSQVMLTSNAPLGSLTTPTGSAFSADGSRLFQCQAGDRTVYQYDLSQNWDISTATYSSVSYDCSSESTSSMTCIAWKPDGTAFYTGFQSTNEVFQYTCTTPYSLASGVSYASKTLDADAQCGSVKSLQFSDDGGQLWIGDDGATASMYEYTLSTEWDLGTASYATKSVDLSTGPVNLAGAYWSADGARVLAVGESAGAVLEYRQWDATAPWDITTLTVGAAKVTESAWTGGVGGVGRTPDSSRLMISFDTNDDVFGFAVNHLAVGF